MFHDIKGKNVKLEGNKNTASWVPSDTGGHFFSAQPLEADHELTLRLDGTGGVELGVVCEEPAQLNHSFSTVRNDGGLYQFLNDVKIHKRSCTMEFKIDYGKQEVTSTYGRGIYTQKLRMDKKYWLVVDVKYGEVEAKIQKKDGTDAFYSFSSCFGKNVEVLNDITVARSLAKSPASLCIYRYPAKSGLKLELHSVPKAYQGTIPGRYYVRLFVIDAKPEDLQQLHPDRFDVSCNKSETPRWTKVETFEKEDCHGTITLELEKNSLKYKSANCKISSQDFSRLGKDIWLVFELYGVTVTMKEGLDSQNMSKMGEDVPDAARVPPRSFVTVGSNVQPVLMPIQETDENLQPVQPTFDVNSRTVENDLIHMEKGIRKNFTSLLRSLTAPHFVDLLYENEYISLEQMESIHAAGTDQVRKVLMVMTKKPIRRRLLEDALQKTEQQFLLAKFLNEEEKQ